MEKLLLRVWSSGLCYNEFREEFIAMKLVLATGNLSKMKQIQEVLGELSVTILSLEDVGFSKDVVEDGETIEENAIKKAVFARQQSGLAAIADDTGLFIDALQGEPGVRSARWAGEQATTEEIMRFTLEKLKGVPRKKRTATFRTVAALALPNLNPMLFFGRVEGVLLEEPRVPCHPKMPYSALFVPKGQDKSWAEMSLEEENLLSHRGRAFRKAREYIEILIRKGAP